MDDNKKTVVLLNGLLALTAVTAGLVFLWNRATTDGLLCLLLAESLWIETQLRLLRYEKGA